MLKSKFTNLGKPIALVVAIAVAAMPGAGLLPAWAQDLTPPAATSESTVAATPMTPTNTGGQLAVKSLLVFPFANDAGASSDDIAAKLDDAVRLRLNSVNKFTVIQYNQRLPQIERAVDVDKDLSRDDVTPPFSDSTKAGHVASRIGTGAYILGALESFNVDATTKRTNVEVSVTVVNTATNANVNSFVVRGTAAPVSASDTSDSVVQAAINDAASKVASSINGLAPTAPLESGMVARNNGAGSALLVLLAGALAYAALHHSSGSSSSNTGGSTSGGGNGGGTTGPPPPP